MHIWPRLGRSVSLDDDYKVECERVVFVKSPRPLDLYGLPRPTNVVDVARLSPYAPRNQPARRVVKFGIHDR